MADQALQVAQHRPGDAEEAHRDDGDCQGEHRWGLRGTRDQPGRGRGEPDAGEQRGGTGQGAQAEPRPRPGGGQQPTDGAGVPGGTRRCWAGGRCAHAAAPPVRSPGPVAAALSAAGARVISWSAPSSRAGRCATTTTVCRRPAGVPRLRRPASVPDVQVRRRLVEQQQRRRRRRNARASATAAAARRRARRPLAEHRVQPVRQPGHAVEPPGVGQRRDQVGVVGAPAGPAGCSRPGWPANRPRGAAAPRRRAPATASGSSRPGRATASPHPTRPPGATKPSSSVQQGGLARHPLGPTSATSSPGRQRRTTPRRRPPRPGRG